MPSGGWELGMTPQFCLLRPNFFEDKDQDERTDCRADNRTDPTSAAIRSKEIPHDETY